MSTEVAEMQTTGVEHPWDTGSDGRNAGDRRNDDMKRPVRQRINVLAALVAITLLLPIGTLVAQTTVPPMPTMEGRSPKKINLSREAREVADEYADVLGELRSTVGDYREYLGDSQSETIKRYLVKLDRFATNLNRTAYLADRDKLAGDLDSQIDDVDEVETYIRDSKEVFSSKTYKVVRSLKRDLTSVRDLLESDLIDQLDELNVKTDDLAAYLDDAMKDLDRASRRLDESVSRRDAEAAQHQTDDARKMADEIRKQVQKEVEAATKAQAKTRVAPVPPVTPRVYVKLPRVPSLNDDEGTSREFSDSVTVTSPKLPITVTNRFGSVAVNGGMARKIVAHWSLEFQADSRQLEKQFLSQARLRVSQSSEGYSVTVDVPDLENGNTRLSNSELTVTLPSANPVVIENSFGDLAAQDLANGADLTNSYGEISVEDIKGPLKISSQMGEVNVSGANGSMTVHNAYAPISLEQCVGDFELENAYNEVTIVRCKGKGTIKNSGAVEVTSHTGDVEIRNSFGSVEVNDLKGNLSIENQFQPVVVRDVTGTVTLVNTNSEINASNIGGSLSANNTFGLITAEGARGPLKLINKNGNIELVLGPELTGYSTVRTSFGTVDLTVPQTANLMVNAKTTFGDIKSFVPVKIDELGQAKRAALKLGRGADSLSIVAENSTININSK